MSKAYTFLLNGVERCTERRDLTYADVCRMAHVEMAKATVTVRFTVKDEEVVTVLTEGGLIHLGARGDASINVVEV